MKSRIRDGCAHALYIALSLVSASCAVIDVLEGEANDEEAIEYPESGIYGLNILAQDRLEIVDMDLSSGLAVGYSMRAEVGDSATLTVKLTTTTGEPWSVGVGSSNGWSVGNWVSPSQTFIALEGVATPDVHLSFQAGATFRIDYFENGDVTRTITKVMTVIAPSQ